MLDGMNCVLIEAWIEASNHRDILRNAGAIEHRRQQDGALNLRVLRRFRVSGFDLVSYHRTTYLTAYFVPYRDSESADLERIAGGPRRTQEPQMKTRLRGSNVRAPSGNEIEGCA